MSKKLITYFSASGRTAKVAEKLANELGAEIYEIKPEVKYTKRIHTVMVIRNGNAFTAYNLGDNGTVIRNSIAEILSYDGRNRHFISAYIISDRHFSKKTVAV